MVTYIVYEESERYQLSSILNLYQSFRDYKEVHILKKPENPADLSECLNVLPPQQVTCEWRIIFLDCSQVYPCENPYNRYQEQFRYIEEFLEQRPSVNTRKFERTVTRFLPTQIYCVTMRCGLYFHIEQEGYLYSDFASKQGRNYRYFIYDVGKEEPESPEYLAFQIICSVLILALNEWPAAMLETGYLYQCALEIDEKKVSEYLSEMEETKRHIGNLLYQEKSAYNYRKEYLNYVQNSLDYVEPLEEVPQTIPFCKEKFPFVSEENHSQLYQWRMKNMNAVQRLEELKKNPIKCWEKEINKRKSQIFPGYEMEEFKRKYLTEGGWQELLDKKRECAEKIFKEQIFDQEFQKRLQESEKIIQCMENEISCRMTKKSIRILLKEIIFGFGIVGLVFFLLITGAFLKDKRDLIMWILVMIYLIVSIIGCTFVFAMKRKNIWKQLNKSLENIDNSLKKADAIYNRVLNQILNHKKYSLLEQQQKKLLREEKERMKIVKEYEQMLCKSEETIQQLMWILGKQPVFCPNQCSDVSVDFSSYPYETIDYYMPHYKKVYDLLMEGTGIQIQVPFFFICNFEIRKLYLPYGHEESQVKKLDGQKDE